MQTSQVELYIREKVAKIKNAKTRDARAQHCVDIFQRMCDTFDGREFLRTYPKMLPRVLSKLQEFSEEQFWGQHFENYLRIIKLIQKRSISDEEAETKKNSD